MRMKVVIVLVLCEIWGATNRNKIYIKCKGSGDKLTQKLMQILLYVK